MDFHVGIGSKDFAMLCCDTSAVQQIITIKNDEEKLAPIDSHKLFSLAGEAGDRVHFCEFVVANVKFYALKNGQHLSTHAVAHFTRKQLADSIRSVRFPGPRFISKHMRLQAAGPLQARRPHVGGTPATLSVLSGRAAFCLSRPSLPCSHNGGPSHSVLSAPTSPRARACSSKERTESRCC